METGEWLYSEASILDHPFRFAGRTFAVADDQPTAAVNDEVGHEGIVQILMEGKPLGEPSRALVRRGRTDLGRYHLWFDAWIFQERATGRRALWIARRIQVRDDVRPAFEVVTVQEDGSVATRRYRTYELGADYRLFRTTQFVRDGTSSAIPLSMLEAVYFWPLLLFYPIGSLALGVILIRRALSSRLA